MQEALDGMIEVPIVAPKKRGLKPTRENMTEIVEKRDQLIDQLEKRLAQRAANETLFTIRWCVM